MKINKLIPVTTILLIAVVLITTAFIVYDKPCGGIYRWKVKTLSDNEVLNVKFTPRKTSIKTLVKADPGKVIKSNTVRFGIEFKTYKIICGMREYKYEDDNDTHIVLYDLNDTTLTMVGEIPDLSCDTSIANKNPYNKMFISAKNDFKMYRAKKGKMRPGAYEIVGVAFFDKVHGQLGGAPNGIELHPILSIKKIK